MSFLHSVSLLLISADMRMQAALCTVCHDFRDLTIPEFQLIILFVFAILLHGPRARI
jgi:hypothetical protein